MGIPKDYLTNEIALEERPSYPFNVKRMIRRTYKTRPWSSPTASIQLLANRPIVC